MVITFIRVLWRSVSTGVSYLDQEILFSEKNIEYWVLLKFTGTHITNTREAKAFALLSEDGISKGIRRIIAVTTKSAFDSLNTASLLEKEVDEASKAVGNALEKVLSHPLTN